MLHSLINALALASATATTGPSQHIQDLNAILNQVEKFYGQGWHSLSMENAAIFAVAAAVITVIGVVVGALVPILINNRAEKRMLREIALAQRKARVNAEMRIKEAITRLTNEFEHRMMQLEETAKKQTDAARNKASESIKQQEQDLTTLIKQEASNAKNSTTGFVLRITAAHVSGEYGTSVTSPAQFDSAIRFFFSSMCYDSLAGAVDECRLASSQLTRTISKLKQTWPEFNGPQYATMLENLRNDAPRIKEHGNSDCEAMIDKVLNTLKGTPQSQDGTSPAEKQTPGPVDANGDRDSTT